MVRTKATLKRAEQAKKRGKTEQKPTPAPTRHSTRIRKQTVLHVAPDFHPKSSTKKGKGRRKAKPEVVVIEKKGKGGKVTKTKVLKGRIQDAKPQKKASASRKGNDRLIPRPEVKIYKENPFFSSVKPPEYVSFVSNVRLLIRAITKGDLKEMRRLMKPDCRYIDAPSCSLKFSYAQDKTPDGCALLCNNDAVRQEYFKLRSQLKPGKTSRREPNLLRRKTTGQSNFYMLGRATRAVEMTRGGREGNNAFLNFESQTESESGKDLVMNGMSYKDLVKVSKEPDVSSALHLNVNFMDGMVVVAARMGSLDVASAFAEGPASSNLNDLHRETLNCRLGNDVVIFPDRFPQHVDDLVHPNGYTPGPPLSTFVHQFIMCKRKVLGRNPKLPERILPVSVLKKGYNNANITPLHTASINPNVKVLERLRTIEPNINIPDSNNWYTIHYAAVCEGPEPLKYLLKNGAPPTALTKQHETPLHAAAHAGRKENIKILLEAMAKLETTDGDVPMIKPEKSLVNARTRQGDTALCLAVRGQKPEAVTALLAHKTVLVDHPTSTSKLKMSPLMIACSLGNLEIAEILIAHGALIMAKDHKKRTALSHAIINGQEHCAAMLLAKGADFFKGDSSNNTPAHYAAAYGWLECLKLLANVDPSCLKQENDWKLTPLSIAYLKGHYGIVQWLLDEMSEYVDINGKDMEGVTLLSSLLRYTDEDAQSELLEQMQYLLSRGADCSIADSLGNDVMHVFAGINVRLRDPNDNSEKGMLESEYRACFEEIMKHGGNVERRNESAQTPLHIALGATNLILFKWMLEHLKDVRTTLAVPWSAEANLLHILLAIPVNVWANRRLWRGDQPPSQHLYDVLPVINDVLLRHCSEEVNLWLHQPNAEGLQPILYAARAYQKASRQPNCQPFVDYMTKLIVWICQLCPDCLTMVSAPKKDPSTSWHPTTSLIYFTLMIQMEDGSLQLLRQLLQLAVEKKKLRDLMELIGPDGYGLMISALKTNPVAAGLLLRTTKEHGYTDGVHNVILVREAGRKDEERKLLNKSLAMLIVEMKRFELMNELQLSQRDWLHCDANGDNLWHYAARTQDLRALELFRLFESKGIPIKPDNQQSTPLHEAVQTCDCSANSVLEPIEWLAANCPQAARDTFGRTPLHYAFASRAQLSKGGLTDANRDPIAVVTILTRNMTKQQLDWADCDGNTALHLAAFKNANICAVTLLRKGVSVTIKNKDGNSPLAVAVLHGRQAVALTLIQAESNVTDKVYPAKPAQLHIDLWKWKGAVKEKDEEKISTIPAQIVAKGGGWEAMVYVLMDALGTDFTSLLQMIDASLKERQYNLANQLTKSLQARMLGKKLPKSDYHLLLTFAEHFKGDIADDSVEHAVLQRLYALGEEVITDGVSLPLEAAILNGQWALYNHFKARAGKAWATLRPSQPALGPLRNVIVRMSRNKEDFAITAMQELLSLPHFSINEPMSLPLSYDLTEASLSTLPPIAWAATLDESNLVLLLRTAGADVNATDLEGRTPLMIALLANKVDTVQALCGDGVLRDNEAAKKVPKMPRAPGGRMLLGAFLAKGRKRKAPESDNDERAESEDGSQEGTPRADSVSEADEEENNDNQGDTPPPKRTRIVNKKLDIMASDRRGRNIMHYMVAPIQWENVDLFLQLHSEAPAKIKQLLQQKDREGNTPLEIAVRTKQRRMVNAMKSVLGAPTKKQKITNGFSVSDLPDVTNLACEFDIDADSKAYIERWIVEHDTDSEPEIPKPSKMSGYSETADLVRDPVTQQIMAAVLNKTDLTYGRYGFHNFYRIELMKRRDTDLWILFTNWGRIGSGHGEFQTTPFNNIDAAFKEFKSVWRSKTGQDWGPFDEFQTLPKKYKLVETTKRVSNLSEIDIPHEEKKEEDVVRRAIQDLSNVKKLKDYARQINWDVACPFGHITEAAIERARAVLEQCKQNVKDLNATLAREGHTDVDVLQVFDKSRTLTAQFYENFPVGNFAYGAIEILDNDDHIRKAQSALNRLTEVEVSTRILTAAAQHPELDRLSFITSALECGFTEMKPTDEMSQMILRYIHVTGEHSAKIKTIISLSPRTATLNFEKFVDEENQKFLWHGTKAVNLLSILKDGFLVDPHNTSITGRLFGDGIYLSDAFQKSVNYCEASAKHCRYMLLCRVALGKSYTLKSWDYSANEVPPQYDSLHVIGRRYPKTSITVNGVAMPMCDFGDHSRDRYVSLEYSEYIVRDSTRILPQYLVIFNASGEEQRRSLWQIAP